MPHVPAGVALEAHDDPRRHPGRGDDRVLPARLCSPGGGRQRPSRFRPGSGGPSPLCIRRSVEEPAGPAHLEAHEVKVDGVVRVVGSGEVQQAPDPRRCRELGLPRHRIVPAKVLLHSEEASPSGPELAGVGRGRGTRPASASGSSSPPTPPVAAPSGASPAGVAQLRACAQRERRRTGAAAAGRSGSSAAGAAPRDRPGRRRDPRAPPAPGNSGFARGTGAASRPWSEPIHAWCSAGGAPPHRSSPRGERRERVRPRVRGVDHAQPVAARLDVGVGKELPVHQRRVGVDLGHPGHRRAAGGRVPQLSVGVEAAVACTAPAAARAARRAQPQRVLPGRRVSQLSAPSSPAVLG